MEDVPERWKGLMGSAARLATYSKAGAELEPDAKADSAGCNRGLRGHQ